MKTRETIDQLVGEYGRYTIAAPQHQEPVVERAKVLVNELVTAKRRTPLEVAAKVARVAGKFTASVEQLGGDSARAKSFAQKVGFLAADSLDRGSLPTTLARPTAARLPSPSSRPIAPGAGLATPTSPAVGVDTRPSSRAAHGSANAATATGPAAGQRPKRRLPTATKPAKILTPRERQELTAQYEAGNVTQTQLATKFQVSLRTVNRIVKLQRPSN